MPDPAQKDFCGIKNCCRLYFTVFNLCLFALLPAGECFSEEVNTAIRDSAGDDNIVMTLDECIGTALMQNPDIEIKKIDLINTEKNITIEESAFDPELSAGFSYSDSRAPTSSLLTKNKKKAIDFEVGYGRTITNGDSYELSLSHEKSDTNSLNSVIDPAYSMDITFSYTKPLLREKGKDVNLSRLMITNLNREISELELKARIVDIVSQVDSAYWSLVYARENLNVKEESLGLVKETLKQTNAMIDAGSIAESQKLLVESQSASREEDVIVAGGDVRKAVLALKLVMNISMESELWEKEIVPGIPGVETISFDPLPFDEGLKTALANKTDYLNAAKTLEIRKIETTAYRNRVKPSVDLVSSVGVEGLHDNYSKSVQDVTSFQYPSMEVGLWMELPVGQRQSRMQLEQSKNNEIKARFEIDKTRNTIAVELAEIEVTLRTARKKIQAAKITREYAEKKLREEEEKYMLGIATIHDVLEYQEDLAIAKLNESKAIVDFNESVTDYYYILGTLLDFKKIKIANDITKIIQP